MNYRVRWKAKVTYEVIISASSPEEAERIWCDGDSDSDPELIVDYGVSNIDSIEEVE